MEMGEVVLTTKNNNNNRGEGDACSRTNFRLNPNQSLFFTSSLLLFSPPPLPPPPLP
ncbi:hypothetical protein Syun_027828 [Stephania yunnanensis]|uniref:Uncharacterized protein n=1 Tax=Stephania yunnanensis TaxID=152371 RepID=A0AAP0EJM0_9MAGN